MPPSSLAAPPRPRGGLDRPSAAGPLPSGQRFLDWWARLDPYRLRGALWRGPRMRVDGSLDFDGEYPAFGGRVRIERSGVVMALPLPAVQLAPHWEGILIWEVRIRLFGGRF